MTPATRPTASLAPVALALVAAATSLLFAAFTLYPRGDDAARVSSVVHAAESSTSRRTPLAEGSMTTSDAARLDLGPHFRALEAAGAAQLSLTCKVLDEEGQPVAGASIWADDGEYTERGITDGAGVFALSLDASTVRARWSAGARIEVGARHDQHGPALLRSWSGPHAGDFVLQLRGGGASLQLQVVDDSSMLVPGVRVQVRPELSGARAPLGRDGLPGLVTTGATTATDGWGEVLLRGLEPGQAKLTLRAAGYCPRTIQLELIEDECTKRRLRLFHSSTVQGRLTRADGGPASCARITGVGEDQSYVVVTYANSRGEFELRDLQAGEVELRAECRENGSITHAASAEIKLSPGERRTWSEMLYPVGVVSGRLLDSNGSPLVGWRLELRLEDALLEPLHVTRTDETGLYELPDSHAGQVAQLFIYHPQSGGGFPTRVLDDPRSGDGDIALEPDEERSAPMIGRLRHADGRPALGVSFMLHRLGTGQNLAMMSSPEDASFTTSPLPPGDYILIFHTYGRGWVPDARYHIGDGDLLDIGSLSLPSFGLLALAPSVPGRESECREIKLVLHRPQIDANFTYIVQDGRVDLPIELQLAPGSYSLQTLDSPGSPRVDFDVSATLTTELVVPCQP